jgi:hypothetical protein
LMTLGLQELDLYQNKLEQMEGELQKRADLEANLSEFVRVAWPSIDPAEYQSQGRSNDGKDKREGMGLKRLRPVDHANGRRNARRGTVPLGSIAHARGGSPIQGCSEAWLNCWVGGLR